MTVFIVDLSKLHFAFLLLEMQISLYSDLHLKYFVNNEDQDTLLPE